MQLHLHDFAFFGLALAFRLQRKSVLDKCMQILESCLSFPNYIAGSSCQYYNAVMILVLNKSSQVMN